MLLSHPSQVHPVEEDFDCIRFRLKMAVAPTKVSVTSPSLLTKEEESFLKALKLESSSSCNPQVLQLFFAVLTNCDRAKRSEILEKFLIFPWVKPGNQFQHVPKILLTIPHWQELIYVLFENPDTNTSIPLEPGQEQKLFGLAMFILSMTHYHYLNAAPHNKDYEDSMLDLLTNSLDELHEFAGWSDDVVMLARLMLNSLVQILINNKINFIDHPDSVIWDRLFQILDVIEGFLFYRPSQSGILYNIIMKNMNDGQLIFGIHIDDEHGLCQDLLLVEKVLELFDTAMNIDKLEEKNPITNDKSKAKAQASNIKRSKQYRDYFHEIAVFFKDIETQKLDPKLEEKFFDQFIETCLSRQIHQDAGMDKKKMKEKFRQTKDLINESKKGQNFGGAAKLAQNLLQKKPSVDTKQAPAVKENKANPANTKPAETNNNNKNQLALPTGKKQGTLEARLDNYKTIVPEIKSIRGARNSIMVNMSAIPASMNTANNHNNNLAPVNVNNNNLNPNGNANAMRTMRSMKLGGLGSRANNPSNMVSNNNNNNNITQNALIELAKLEAEVYCIQCLNTQGSLAPTKNKRNVVFEPCFHITSCIEHSAPLVNCPLPTCNVKLTSKRQVKFK